MSKHHDKVRIGTCSWKYPEWHGLVYSAPRGIDYLQEYSPKYSTVEIDQWFWSLFSPETGAKMPTPADVQRYRCYHRFKNPPKSPIKNQPCVG